MLRLKHLKKQSDDNIKYISEYFCISEDNVTSSSIPNTFIVLLETEISQDKYKQMNPFGNSLIPKMYDFNQEILVRYDHDEQVPKLVF